MAEFSKQTHEALQAFSKERLIDIILLQAEKIAEVEKENADLKNRIDKLEAKLNSNSTNSSQPPSSDNPYKKPIKNSGKKGKPGAKKGHKGYRQEMLPPTKIVNVPPERCSCGCEKEYNKLEPFYTHQHFDFRKSSRWLPTSFSCRDRAPVAAS
jgi:transposase